MRKYNLLKTSFIILPVYSANLATITAKIKTTIQRIGCIIFLKRNLQILSPPTCLCLNLFIIKKKKRKKKMNAFSYQLRPNLVQEILYNSFHLFLIFFKTKPLSHDSLFKKKYFSVFYKFSLSISTKT